MKILKNIFLCASVLTGAIMTTSCTGDNASATDAKSASFPNECPYKAAKSDGCVEKFEEGKILNPYFEMLKNTYWAPVSIKGQGDIKTPMEGGKFVVYMRFDDNCRLNGISGDNLFGGNVSIGTAGKFVADKLYTTRRMGPYSNYERVFLEDISGADKILVDGDTLRLLKNETEMAKFKKIAKEEIQTN